ncbi:MAG: sulfotransferase family 2 domain-containing protein [Pseudomonadota bacterium]
MAIGFAQHAGRDARMTGLLRHSSGQWVELAQNLRHQFAARFALVHYASGAVYSYIPKNACSTLRYSLARANGAISKPEDFGWIHANNPTFAASLRDLATAPFSFVVLRCPFARLASAFLDKFVAKGPEAWALRRLDHDRIDLDQLTFRQFTELLANPKLRQSNPHWRPQEDFLVYDTYSAVYAFEDFEAAAHSIQANTGLQVHDARDLSAHGLNAMQPKAGAFTDTPVHQLAAMRRSNEAPLPSALYDADTVKAIARHYVADIALYSCHFGTANLMFEAVSD